MSSKKTYVSLWMIHLVAFFFFLVPAIYAETGKNDRRIEELKRTAIDQTTILYGANDTIAAPILSQEMLFLSTLIEQPIAYKRDLVSVFSMTFPIDVSPTAYADIVQYLENEEHLSSAFFTDLDQPLRKGEAALIVSRALRVRGGVMRFLVPWSPRYAFNELVYRGIMYGGYATDVIEGKELVLMLHHMVQYLLLHQES